MNDTQQKLQLAMAYAMKNRPKVGGFPFLAECLRKAGVEKNIWSLPSAQSIYITKEGSVVNQGTPLISGMTEVPVFNEEVLIKALRTDQAGESTFPEFLLSAWNAGVVGYEVDLINRTVSYRGILGEEYMESYPKVEVGEDDGQGSYWREDSPAFRDHSFQEREIRHDLHLASQDIRE